jgi:hypothetical protein
MLNRLLGYLSLFARPVLPATKTIDKDQSTILCTKNHELAEVKLQLRERMHDPAALTGKWLKSVRSRLLARCS